MEDSNKLTCPECGAEMLLKRSKFKNPYFFGCSRYPICDGTHGAHPNGQPLGVPANKATKQARILAHEAFDVLWKFSTTAMTRKRAYKLLAEALGVKEVHIAEQDIAGCNRIIQESNRLREKLAGAYTDDDLPIDRDGLKDE